MTLCEYWHESSLMWSLHFLFLLHFIQPRMVSKVGASEKLPTFNQAGSFQHQLSVQIGTHGSPLLKKMLARKPEYWTKESELNRADKKRPELNTGEGTS